MLMPKDEHNAHCGGVLGFKVVVVIVVRENKGLTSSITVFKKFSKMLVVEK